MNHSSQRYKEPMHAPGPISPYKPDPNLSLYHDLRILTYAHWEEDSESQFSSVPEDYFLLVLPHEYGYSDYSILGSE